VRHSIVAVADWMNKESGEAIDLSTAARRAGLSPYHFLRIFKLVIGVTPHQHLVRCRLGRAARLLLEGELAITQAAYGARVGDLSNFVRSFRRAAGVSPRRYRKLSAADRKICQDSVFGTGFPPPA